MLVREYLEYLKVCKGYEGILEQDKEKYKYILNSDIDINKYIEACDKIDLGYKTKWDILLNLVKYTQRSELKTCIDTLSNTLEMYDRYLYKYDYHLLLERLPGKIYYKKNESSLDIINSLKLVLGVERVLIYEHGKKSVYGIHRVNDTILLKDKTGKEINNIYAIIVKDKRMEFMREKIDNFGEFVYSYNYDLVIL